MGIKNTMQLLGGKSTDAIKMMAKEFGNLEDKIITVQNNQVEFEKYLISINDKLDKLDMKIDKLNMRISEI